MEPASGEAKRLLGELRRGSSDAEAELLPPVSLHLRRVPARCMRRELPDQSLHPAALLSEA